jgi:hypothetical protein
MDINAKIKSLEDEIKHYRQEKNEALENREYANWLEGLILGLSRGLCILNELKDKPVRENISGYWEDGSDINWASSKE